MKSQLKEIRIDRPIGDALTDSVFDLLPDELRNDFIVSWLRDYSRQGYDQSDYENDHRSENYLIIDLLKKIISNNFKFYSAVLFYIGRRLKVTQLANQKIAEALEPKNLQKTIITNDSLSINMNRFAMTDIMRETLTEARRVHENVADQNFLLWDIWKKEMRQFQEAIQVTNEKLNRIEYNRHNNPLILQAPARLMRDSFQNKALKKNMDALGFRVDIDETIDAQTLTLLQLLSMDEYELRNRVELIRQENINKGLDVEALRRQREQEMSSYIQNQLMQEFGDKDPFEAYRPLGKIPDENLYTLFNKCKLPDNSIFYYAKRWLDMLDKPFYYYEDRIPVFKPELTVDDIRHYAHSADSAIKRYWVENNGNSPNLPQQRIQYALEKNWIELMIIAIRYESKKHNSGWSLSAVTGVIHLTIDLLNELGYKLNVPESDRLEKLWTTAGDNNYRINW